MLEKLTFWQGVVLGLGIGFKNGIDPVFQNIQNNPYLSAEEKEKMLLDKFLSESLHDCKTVDDLLKLIDAMRQKK